MSNEFRSESAKAGDAARIEDRLAEVASRCEFSPEAVAAMWQSIIRGRGAMAQFSHPEFGGHGQWMRNGMVMVSDMFNHALAAKVGRLCDELSKLYLSAPEAVRSNESPEGADGNWWPRGLDGPSSTGSQDGVRYAFFPSARRLVIERSGSQEVYDTGDHIIGGVSQQQGGAHRLSFSSQRGDVDLRSLKRMDSTPRSDALEQRNTPFPIAREASPVPEPAHVRAQRTAQSHEQVLETLERLAALHGKGILSDDEFGAKKAELLARL